MKQTPYNSLLMSSITPGHENRSHYTTQIAPVFAHSQQILTQLIRFVDFPLMSRQVIDKLYTSFWTHLALRDRVAPGYTHTVEATPPDYTPYLTGHAHGTAYLPHYFVPKFVEDAQVEYELSLSPAEHIEYTRGYVEGFSEQPCQPEREVAK